MHGPARLRAATASDATGLAGVLIVAGAFTGYVALSEGTAIMPGLYFFNPSITADTDILFAVQP